MSTATRKILFKLVQDLIPGGHQMAYNRRCTGKIEWLSHLAPDGHKTFALWVDPDALLRWAAHRGKQIVHREKLMAAIEKYSVSVVAA